MNPPSSILIAGAGFLGTQLAELLAEAGCHAYTLRRSPTPLQASTAPASTPTRIHPIQADLLEPSTLADLPATIDAVVFAASAAVRGAFRLFLGFQGGGPFFGQFILFVAHYAHSSALRLLKDHIREIDFNHFGSA